jgi:hypothetical protein
MSTIPCPCGGQPEVRLHVVRDIQYYLKCPKCGKVGACRSNRDEAIRNWNMAVTPTPRVDTMASIMNTCFKCGCKLSVVEQIGDWVKHTCCRCKNERKCITF